MSCLFRVFVSSARNCFEQVTDQHVELEHEQIAFKLETDRRDAGVVLVLLVDEKLWVKLEHRFDAKRLDAENAIDVDR